MRVYRDTRFARGGEPYKTNVGIQFRHEQGATSMPRASTSTSRRASVSWPWAYGGPIPRRPARSGRRSWRGPGVGNGRRDDRKFRARFALDGGSLKRPPRGFPADHRWIEDIKRTDFIAVEELEEQDVLGKGFLDHVADSFVASRPFMRFLCDALKVPF